MSAGLDLLIALGMEKKRTSSSPMSSLRGTRLIEVGSGLGAVGTRTIERVAVVGGSVCVMVPASQIINMTTVGDDGGGSVGTLASSAGSGLGRIYVLGDGWVMACGQSRGAVRLRPLCRNAHGLGSCTLRGGAVACVRRFGVDTMVACVGGLVMVPAVAGMLLLKISASLRSAMIFSLPTLVKGVLVCGLCRAVVRSSAASMAASTDNIFGMEYRWGENSTV